VKFSKILLRGRIVISPKQKCTAFCLYTVALRSAKNLRLEPCFRKLRTPRAEAQRTFLRGLFFYHFFQRPPSTNAPFFTGRFSFNAPQSNAFSVELVEGASDLPCFCCNLIHLQRSVFHDAADLFSGRRCIHDDGKRDDRVFDAWGRNPLYDKRR